MLILGLDTSGKNGSIALVRLNGGAGKAFNREGREELPQSSQSTAAQTLEVVPLEGGTFSAQLVPQISALLQKHGFAKQQIDAFAVATGPGSFTGLRVGLAAIKGLAEILRKPIAAVSLLEVIASEVILVAGRSANAEARAHCWVVLDGGRREVYAGNYEIGASLPLLLREELLSYEQLVSLAEELGKKTLILSPDKSLIDLSISCMSDPFLANFSHVERPDAGSIARFGWRKITAGAIVSPEALDATYIRRSEAEIKFAERVK